MKSRLVFKYVLFLLLVSTAGRAEECLSAERKKTILRLYDISDKDNLVVENQYGQVKVNIWDRKEIKVEIVITANCVSEDDVAAYLNSVNIEEGKAGGQLRIKTVIDRKSFGGVWNSLKNVMNWKNSIRIDYTVSMPKNIPLVVSNEFGDTNIPFFQAALTVDARYGGFYADELNGDNNVVAVSYGKVAIGRMNEGTMAVRYSDLAVEKAHSLVLENRYGKLSIGEINVLTANVDYSGSFYIGKVLDACTINVSYSGGLRIGELSPSANAVTIRSAYSSVAVPVESGSFDVTVSYGNFNFPRDGKTSFTHLPASDAKHQPTKQFEGKIGTGAGPRIKVVSRYGSVTLKD
jgi:hypothetical protein